MEKFQLQPGERLLVNDPHASWIRTEMSPVAGQLKLTDRRLVFIKDSNPFGIFFLYLIPSMRRHIELEFPLDSINSVSCPEFGKEKRFTVENTLGRPKNFVTSKADIFEPEVNKLISK